MEIDIELDEQLDADLIAAIESMPKGERSERLKALIRLAQAGTGGLLVRMEALERRLTAMEGSSGVLSPHR